MSEPLADLRRVLVGLLFVVGLSAAIILFYAPIPFLLIPALAAAASLVIAVRAETEWGQRLALVGLGLSLTLFLGEAAFMSADALDGHTEVLAGTARERSYNRHDPELGYEPGAAGRYTSSKTVDGKLVYDVTYTITPHRIRQTPGDPEGLGWVFMGGSQTFGSGVEDDETLPAAFSRRLHYSANVLNLGFSGYGPHQMLRALETDRIRAITDQPIAQVIYQGIWAHVPRAAGRAPWDHTGPSYELQGDSVAYTGPFHGTLARSLIIVAQRSRFLAAILDRTLYRAHVDDADVELYGRVVAQSARLAQERYGAGFLVVFWDEDNEFSRRIVDWLRASSLDVLYVSEVIPRSEWPGLTLGGDPHPNAEAYDRLAAALVDYYFGSVER